MALNVNNILEVKNFGEKEFKVCPLNGGKYLDMSNERGTLSKFGLYLHDVFTEGELDGVIIKRNLTKSKFEELEEKYRNYKVEYVKHGGFVIIYENFSTGVGHFYCVGALECLNVVLTSGPGISISLPNGSIQPDLSLIPDGRQSLVPTTVVEVGVSQSVTHLVKKCESFFRNAQIEIVLGIKIFPKGGNNTFRAVAFFYSRTGSLGTCQSIVSFGSCKTTANDEELFLELTNNNNNNQNPNILSGVLSNHVLNNAPNTAPFVINIPLAVLLNGASPQPQFLPNMLQAPINAPIDLFTVKSFRNKNSIKYIFFIFDPKLKIKRIIFKILFLFINKKISLYSVLFSTSF
ncbi:hypothetical protein ACTFIY_007469 [Dictyostelium cf. discoideum]